MNAQSIPTSPRPSPIRRGIGRVGALVVGAVLLFSVYAKAIDPERFAEHLQEMGLAGGLPLSPLTLAFVALGVQTLLGLLLVFNVRRLWVLVPALLLVLLLLALNLREWILTESGGRDARLSCGCFGNLLQRTPQEALWQDLLLLGLPMALAFAGRAGTAWPRLWSGLSVVLTAGVLVFAVRAPALDLDDLATRLSPGVRLADICVGEGADRICLTGETQPMLALRALEEGTHYVILTDLEEPAFLEGIEALNEAMLAGAPSVVVVTAKDAKEDAIRLEMEHGARFEVHITPRPLLRSLYRRLPRSFLVQDGVVQATWSGMPPLPRAAP